MASLFKHPHAPTPKIEIIHEVENGHHRLCYENGKCGEWAEYEEIARLDNYCAVTNYWSPTLPPCFKIEEVRCKNHYLKLNDDDYWMGE